MAVAKEIVAGVGTRYGVVFPLNADGIPNVASASATPTQGTLIHGIKGLNITDPEPRRFNHSGNDNLLAQDSLPPLEGGSYTFSTPANNFKLDNTLAGTKSRTLGNAVFRAGNNDKKGNEPLVATMFYQQALDVDPDSETYGKLRQWHGKIYPANRITNITKPMSDGTTDQSYSATPTPVKETIWGETLNESNWGVTRAEYIEFNMNYQPRLNFFKGNGTLTSFNLSHNPFSSSELVIVNTSTGAQLTPTGVNIDSQMPNFTLGSAVGVDVIIAAIIGTNEPGDS